MKSVPNITRCSVPDVVPNLPKCAVPVLMSHRFYRSVRHRYYRRYVPAVCLGTYRTEHTLLLCVCVYCMRSLSWGSTAVDRLERVIDRGPLPFVRPRCDSQKKHGTIRAVTGISRLGSDYLDYSKEVVKVNRDLINLIIN